MNSSSVLLAIAFSALVLIVVVFQLALAAGMPLGELTWGGRFPGRLPVRMRIVAIVSAVILGAFGLIVAIRAGVVLPEWQPLSRVLIWFVVAYCALGVLANAVTPSRWERRIWLPVVAVLLVLSTTVALR
ncbi:MAG: hypothetical protein H0U67_03040 [Gemmatimonadetes bacterium]|nr:hypothetical protein [Gemmatimonadota bacterium]